MDTPELVANVLTSVVAICALAGTAWNAIAGLRQTTRAQQLALEAAWSDGLRTSSRDSIRLAFDRNRRRFWWSLASSVVLFLSLAVAVFLAFAAYESLQAERDRDRWELNSLYVVGGFSSRRKEPGEEGQTISEGEALAVLEPLDLHDAPELEQLQRELLAAIAAGRHEHERSDAIMVRDDFHRLYEKLKLGIVKEAMEHGLGNIDAAP